MQGFNSYHMLLASLKRPHILKRGVKIASKILPLASIIITALLVAQPTFASSYQQVYDVVFDAAETPASMQPIGATHNKTLTPVIQNELAVYQAGQLPAYKVSAGKFTKTVQAQLVKRSRQTLTDTADYYPRLEKLVHSNGICMAGKWHITEDGKNSQGQRYTGMFAKGAESLFIGRLSVALSDTKQGQYQAFGMAGKIFGSNNRQQTVTTENFFVADVLTGARRASVFAAPMTNKPKIGFRFSVLSLGLKIAPIFSSADSDASMRPINGIAAMGVGDAAGAAKVVSPKYMMVVPIPPFGHQVIAGIDFRHEFTLTSQEISKGITRDIALYVSDTASQPEDIGWQYVGYIKADNTIVSYGCDRQLHFAHPKVG